MTSNIRVLLNFISADTCRWKLTSVQARQPLVWTVTSREDRCAAGYQVHIDLCFSILIAQQ